MKVFTFRKRRFLACDKICADRFGREINKGTSFPRVLVKQGLNYAKIPWIEASVKRSFCAYCGMKAKRTEKEIIDILSQIEQEEQEKEEAILCRRESDD